MATAAHRMGSKPLAVLSPDNTVLLIAGANGLITCYSVKEFCQFLRSFEDPRHLSRIYISLEWGELSTESKSAGSSTSSNTTIIAAGCSNGIIVLFNYATGTIMRTLDSKAAGHTQRVNDIKFGASKQYMYSCSNDGTIIQWNLKTGQVSHVFREKAPVLAIAVSSDESHLVVADTSIRIYDLVSKKVIAKKPGHAAPISALAVSNDNQFVASSSRDETTSLWKLKGDNPKDQAAVATFISPTCGRQLVVVHEPEKSLVTVYGRTASGYALVWNHNLLATASAPSQAKCMIRTEKVSGTKLPGVIAMGVEHPNKVHVAFGEFAVPRFISLQIMKDNQYITRLPIRPKDLHLVSRKESHQPMKLAKDAKTVLTKGNQMLVGDKDAHEAQLETLRNIDMTETTPVVSFAQQVLMSGVAVEGGEQDAVKPSLSACNAIADAIRSKNNHSLQKTLLYLPYAAIDNTVKNLPIFCIAPVMTALGQMLHAQYASVSRFRLWLRSILTNHSSVLISNPHLVAIFSNIYQLIDDRLSTYQKMNQLHHKLEMFVHLKRKGGPADIEVDTSSAFKFNEESWLAKNRSALSSVPTKQASGANGVDEDDDNESDDELEDLEGLEDEDSGAGADDSMLDADEDDDDDEL